MLPSDTKALLEEVVAHLRSEHEVERKKALRQLKMKMAGQGLLASSALNQSTSQVYCEAIGSFACRLWTKVKCVLEEIRFDTYASSEQDLIQFFNEALSQAAEADYRSLGSLKHLPVQVQKATLQLHYKQAGARIATDVRILCRKIEAMTEQLDKPPSARGESEGHAETAVTKDTRTVFVVHGRNEALRKSMFEFLHAINLKPLEWSQALAATSEATPYIGQVLDKAFSIAQAVVVLMTPDDEAWLREEFRSDHDPYYEKEPTGQARPNVLFEAGMAMGCNAARTVFVEVGKLRPLSDIAGRHIVRLDNSTERRQDLADRLRKAGCAVDLTGRDWHKAGSFEHKPKKPGKERQRTPERQTMKLTFTLNQGEALRRGVDCPCSSASIEVTSARLTEQQRDRIADHMKPGSSDVYAFRVCPLGRVEWAERIAAITPDIEGLLRAIKENDREVGAELKRRDAEAGDVPF
jgi:predicted nucleotide-binding protein